MKLFTIAIFLLVGYFITILGLVHYISVKTYERRSGIQNFFGTYPAILVFGAGVTDSKPSKELQSRLDVALRFWEQDKYSKVFLSGGITLEANEPQVMFTYLESKGIPEMNLRILDSSFNTRETINSFKKIADTLTSGDILAISSPYHSLRIMLEAKKQKLDFLIVSDKYSPEQSHRHILRIRSMTEVIAITFYILPHRFTKTIKTSQYTLRHKIPRKLIELVS